MILQKTIKESIELRGIGLHNGKEVNLCIKPAEANTGIIFKRTDIDNDKNIVEANYKYGMKHGVFKVYDDSGTILLSQREYKRNKLKEKFEWNEDEGLSIVHL